MSVDWQEIAADLAQQLRALHDTTQDPEISRRQLGDCPDTCPYLAALRRYEAARIDGTVSQ